MRNLRKAAQEEKLPVTEFILKRIAELNEEGHMPRTLLAVCPNSMAVIKAALRSAKRNNAPIKFAATLNQVDGDGGYTGLTQKDFVRVLKQESSSIGFSGVTIIAIDHGGPWLKDIQNTEKWSLNKAMSAVKKSFEDALDAGYDLIHVDPTVDIFLKEGETIDIKIVVERTLDLIQHVEQYRRKSNKDAISYEVGTEEVHGGLADDITFDAFLSLLKEGLNKRGLHDVWPCFIVGKVGTDLHTTLFDAEVAKNLTEKVKPFGSLIKGHYSDEVSNPEDYPLSGMGAANVGPEFTINEYKGLMELVEIESELYDKEQIALPSNMKDRLWQAVLDSNRWKKWLQADEKGLPFSEIDPNRQEWIIMTCCRYIWQNPEVLVARHQLYENLSNKGYKPEEIVLSHIERSIDKYYRSFNLIGLNDYL